MSNSSMDWEQIVRENAREMLRLALRIVGSSADGRYEVLYGDLRAETVTAERLHTLEGK